MQVQVSVLAVLLLAVLLPSSRAGIAGRQGASQYQQDDGHVVSESSSSSDSSESSSGSAEATPRSPDLLNQARRQDENLEQDQDLTPAWPQQVPDPAPRVSFDQQEDNQALPEYPMTKDFDSGKKMHPGQPWESQYKHGVVPAKLPTRESDNAHRYRHSIIHPYGDDVHA